MIEARPELGQVWAFVTPCLVDREKVVLQIGDQKVTERVFNVSSEAFEVIWRLTAHRHHLPLELDYQAWDACVAASHGANDAQKIERLETHARRRRMQQLAEGKIPVEEFPV